VANSRGGVNHLFIVLTSIKSYVEKFKPKKMYCAWDMRKSSEVAFRKQGDSVYKETRDDEYNAQVHELTSVIENLFESLGIINVYPKRGEADDIIFWLSKKLSGENVIISADTDLLQLVSAETKIFSPIKKILFDIPMMYEKYNMHPNRFCEFKCIVGDKSDNIEGVPGFGNKRALDIIKGEKTLTNDQQKIVDRNKELINLDNSLNEMWTDEYKFYDTQIAAAECKPNFTTFKNICEKFNLNSILKQESKWHDIFFMKSALNDTISKLFA
jgi:DNA polymerase-1